MTSPQPPREPDKAQPEEDKPDTNAVQHHPDPKAEPIPGATDQKWLPKSPSTAGNT